jgi:DNA invertase Pin-like site-specific DNA recombinase
MRVIHPTSMEISAALFNTLYSTTDWKEMTRKAALYARVSTGDQDPQRQINDVLSHMENDDYRYSDDSPVRYVYIETGTDDEREQYQQLWTAVGEEEFDIVFATELSRFSRTGSAEVMRFVEHCIEHDTSLEVLESVISLDVDSGMMEQQIQKLIAALMSELASLQHQQKLERIQSGIKAAQDAGKWTGAPPKGFRVDDGYLRVDVDEYLAVREAVRRIDEGESQRSVAQDTGLNRRTLGNLYNDHRGLYLDADPSARYDDPDKRERVRAALEQVDV